MTMRHSNGSRQPPGVPLSVASGQGARHGRVIVERAGEWQSWPTSFFQRARS
jgi:hypothetical protein